MITRFGIVITRIGDRDHGRVGNVITRIGIVISRIGIVITGVGNVITR